MTLLRSCAASPPSPVSGLAEDIKAIIGTLRKLWAALSEVVARWGRWTTVLLGALLTILMVTYVE